VNDEAQVVMEAPPFPQVLKFATVEEWWSTSSLVHTQGSVHYSELLLHHFNQKSRRIVFIADWQQETSDLVHL
jgi:hypothetical protein